MNLEGQMFKIDEGQVCRVCDKKFTKDMFPVRQLDGEVVHLICQGKPYKQKEEEIPTEPWECHSEDSLPSGYIVPGEGQGQ